MNTQRVDKTELTCGISRDFALLLCGACGFALTAGGQVDANFAKYQLATATSTSDGHTAPFLTDGKVGPRNRWVSTNRSRQRANIFLNEEVEIGSLHLYAFAYDVPSPTSFTVRYLDPVSGVLTVAPGGEISGNTDEAVSVVFDSPITTRQIQVQIDDDRASIDEIAVFSPNGGMGYPLGTGVNLNQARQHRLAFTPASSRRSGTKRRATVDGFVNDTDYWGTQGSGPHWIEFDVSDPPETTPADVRVQTTPVWIGGAHIYCGSSAGQEIVRSGRFQSSADGTTWTDIPGGSFSQNLSPFVPVVFDDVITTARVRLVIDDVSAVRLQEVVLLPPAPDGGSVPGEWPQGTSVVVNEQGDYRDYGDGYYTVGLTQGGSLLTSDSEGGVVAASDAGVLSQQYQALYNVGTDTYRIVNRVSGLALAVEGASLASGAAVIESEYAGMPHQRWKILDSGSFVQFVNAHSEMAIALEASALGSGLEQQPVRDNRPLQRFTLAYQTHFPKKGQGGWSNLAPQLKPDWAYNWGKTDDFPAEVDYWPMQWGSFFWDTWPELVPLWKRVAESIVLMGYNEPDGADQADIPVQIGIEMWPRLEVQEMPLLAPAPVNPTNDWITQFMQGVDDREMRVEYVAVHSYGSTNVDGFINKLQNTYNTFGQREIMVTEYSTVDWSNTNSWTNNDTFNFFAESFWRMEKLPWVRRYAVFIFTDEPGNPISDNRGELRNADGSLTPEGKLFGAWDGDTTIRTDTPYHLQNESTFMRFGSRVGQPFDAAIRTGTKASDTEVFEWMLVPTDVPGSYQIVSVADGRVLSYNRQLPHLVEPGDATSLSRFTIREQEHGWFYIEDEALGRQLNSPDASSVNFANAGTNSTRTRWRLVPVFGGEPGPVRELVGEATGGASVEVSWAEHGFRDLEGFRVTRLGPDGSLDVIAEGAVVSGMTDTVPAPGVYSYEVVAIGDTGESEPASVVVSVDTCDADFDGSFSVDAADVSAAVMAIGGGLDYDGSGEADFFDVVSFLAVFDEGCE